LEGFPGGPATDHGAEAVEFVGREFAFKLEVKTETREGKNVGDEKFGLQARGGESVAGEMAGGGFEDG
jgi:hypothetical protein